jgi:tetratricopeptide (TPR) repeat protein
MLLARIVICGIFFFGYCIQATAAEKEYEKLYKQGVAANKKGDLDEAIRCYSRAISLKSDSYALYFVRGRAYRQKDQYEKAVSDLTRAITLNPGYAEAYNHRGVTYIGKGEKQKALADFRKACELGSKDGCGNVDKIKKEK